MCSSCPLKADFALVRAWKGDRHGNLVYRKTARNFNPMMATAAAVTLAEVEHLVEPGEIEPDAVHTPGSSCGTSCREPTTSAASRSGP